MVMVTYPMELVVNIISKDNVAFAIYQLYQKHLSIYLITNQELFQYYKALKVITQL